MGVAVRHGRGLEEASEGCWSVYSGQVRVTATAM